MSGEKQFQELKTTELKAAIEAGNRKRVQEVCKDLAAQTPTIKISEDLIILAMETFFPSGGDQETTKREKNLDTSWALEAIIAAGGEISDRSLRKLIDKSDTSHLTMLCSTLRQRGGKIPETLLIHAMKSYGSTRERNEAIRTLLPITEKVSEETLTTFVSSQTVGLSNEDSEILKAILKVMRDTNQPLSITPLQKAMTVSSIYASILCEELVTRKLELDALGKLLINQLQKLPKESRFTWDPLDATIDTAAKTNTTLPEGLLLYFLEGENKAKIDASEKGPGTTLEYTNKLLNITIKSNGSFSINAIEKIIDNFPGKPPEGFIDNVINSAIKNSNFSELLAKMIAKKDETYVVAFCDGLTDSNKEVNLKNQVLITPAAMEGLSETAALKVIDTAILTGSKLSMALLEHAIKIKSWACIDAVCNGLTRQGGPDKIPENLIMAAMNIPKGEGGYEACVLVMNAAKALNGKISREVSDAVENKINPPQTSSHTSSSPDVSKVEVEKPKEVNLSDKAKLLIAQLEKYTARIEGYEDGYTHGFWVFRESRGVNRHVNYDLAKELIDDLKKGIDINITFSNDNIAARRQKLVDNLKSEERSNYEDRGGINSTELNSIIETARDYNNKQEDNRPENNTPMLK